MTNLGKIWETLGTFRGEADKSSEIIKEAILNGKSPKELNNDLPAEITVFGLPNSFSQSQVDAVKKALKNRLTLIQGPPGTGKTLVVGALCANWMKEREYVPRILICAPSNTAADLIADRL